MSQPTATRRYNSAQSRERLLQAADELFSERGYDRTTVREVGQRAGVDAAMIARYFGSKAALYLASLRREGHPGAAEAIDVTDEATIADLLDRVGARGPSSTLYAAIRPHGDEQLQAAAIEILTHRLLQPTELAAREADLDQPQLRAELVAAALAGVVLSRTSQAFATLAQASSADVGRLLTQLLSSLLAIPAD